MRTVLSYTSRPSPRHIHSYTRTGSYFFNNNRLSFLFFHTSTTGVKSKSLINPPSHLMVINRLRCSSCNRLRLAVLIAFWTLNPCSQSAVWYGISHANLARVIIFGTFLATDSVESESQPCNFRKSMKLGNFCIGMSSLAIQKTVLRAPMTLPSTVEVLFLEASAAA